MEIFKIKPFFYFIDYFDNSVFRFRYFMFRLVTLIL